MCLVLAVGGLGGCDGAGEIACESDRECSASGLVCETARGVCVECVINGDCLGADQVCRANACVDVVRCRTSRECPGLVCDVDRGYCVECVGDVDCTDGQVCSDDGVCEAPPMRCVSDRECRGLGQVCDTAAGECVQCVRAGDCGAGQVCVANECRAGGLDAGMRDAGGHDAGGADGGGQDAGPRDAGRDAGGGFDAGPRDAGRDAGFDAGVRDAGTADAGTCDGACLCARAVTDNAMVGCEYWPVVTPNSRLSPEFDFGVLITNDEAIAASVEVRRIGSGVIASVVVPPRNSVMLPLPRIAELEFSTTSTASVRLNNAAYRLLSTVPVSVTQMNSVQARIARDCADEMSMDGMCDAFTLDGSRLLPAHRLGTSYRVASRPTRVLQIDDLFSSSLGQASSFVAVVAPQATTLTIQSTANFAAATGGVPAAIAAGSSTSVSLAAGAVLILATAQPGTCPAGAPTDTDGFTTYSYCDPGPGSDPSGTVITSTTPVEVIGGHDCAFVPYNRWACDHLESALSPTPSLGLRYAVSRTTPFTDEPNVVRVVAHAASTITFTPAVRAPIALAAGGMVDVEVRQNVVISGTGAFVVAQHLVGSGYDGYGMDNGGDPSVAVLAPQTDWRTRVAFMVPAGFTSAVGLVTSTGATVRVDGVSVGSFTAIGGTGLSARQYAVGPGHHVVESSAPIQVVSYGTASYVSYLTAQ